MRKANVSHRTDHGVKTYSSRCGSLPGPEATRLIRGNNACSRRAATPCLHIRRIGYSPVAPINPRDIESIDVLSDASDRHIRLYAWRQRRRRDHHSQWQRWVKPTNLARRTRLNNKQQMDLPDSHEFVNWLVVINWGVDMDKPISAVTTLDDYRNISGTIRTGLPQQFSSPELQMSLLPAANAGNGVFRNLHERHHHPRSNFHQVRATHATTCTLKRRHHAR